jgi:hypothetical protein
MNLKLKNYWEPTPKLFRVIGDTLLSVGSIATTYSIISDMKEIAIACLICSIVGKFMTNMATLGEGENQQ